MNELRRLTPEEIEALETQDWLEALDDVFRMRGRARVEQLLAELQISAQRLGATLPAAIRTPYVNSIPAAREPSYPGDLELERRLENLMRWNAMAMVVAANKANDGIGGHISTYASAATLYEVGFNHFFRGPDHPGGADLVYYQGHATPGIYARAFLEGRIGEEHLKNFRLELRDGPGLSSYPHPWLMPELWSFPTVSMGLGPIMAIYQARFLRYLEHRGLIEATGRRVWAFLGDGECDEPESVGALAIAAREGLDNLTFVVNCNLQRLDGPVRGNGSIVQELEGVFRGAGWSVIKVLWGSDWDPVLERDHQGRFARRAAEVVDGEYQKYRVEGGAYFREHFFGKDPELLRLVEHLDDGALKRMRTGGHDPLKVYAAYARAMELEGGPTVILAKTIKGYGLGEAGEGMNITHQQKKLNQEELLAFRDRFDIPLSDRALRETPFYRPPEDAEELRYLRARREALGGAIPARRVEAEPLPAPEPSLFAEFRGGTERPASTTAVFVRLLAKLLRDPAVGELVVPIIPDEARTFGMDALFRSHGIYSPVGQRYEPVDAAGLLYYREAEDGQILEEGITEAGAMSSFIAAGTAYASCGRPMIPFYVYYSMFGFQRVGDLMWAAADARCRGFMVGGTAGRTTLAGEGLQHQDGHAHVLHQVVPTLLSYDPAYAYEIATLVEEGLRRMYVEGEDVYYYLAVGNEAYAQPAMPAGVERGICRGLYRFAAAPEVRGPMRVCLLGSGAILNPVREAQRLLAERWGIGAEVWSVTSYTELRRDALAVERRGLLGSEGEPSWIEACFGRERALFVAASDYLKALPDSIARWLPGRLVSLGTDGFGRSETRKALRSFFEVDARWVVLGALSGLAREGHLEMQVVKDAMRELELDPEKADPAHT